MKRTISEKNTHLGAGLKFPGVIFAKTRPTCTSEDTKKRVVGSDIKEACEWWHIVKSPTRHAIDQITRGEKSFIPVTQRKIGVSYESKPGFNQVTVFSFSDTVLLGCVWT